MDNGRDTHGTRMKPFEYTIAAESMICWVGNTHARFPLDTFKA